MKIRSWSFVLILCLAMVSAEAQEKGSNLRQSYSGKFGFYSPSDGLNNGLLFGVDGITEFVHYDFFLSGTIDLYLKQTFNFFKDPKPEILRQQIALLPLQAGFGYKIVDLRDADTRMYAGAGVGYYLYFYTVDYRASSGGGLLGGPSLTTESSSKNGGNIFGTLFVRILIGKVFVESKYYIAAKKEDAVGQHGYVVNPSGFAVSLGFQY